MKLNHLLLSSMFLLTCATGHTQVKSYSLKKGQALDILLFNTNDEAKETLNRYFKEAIPVAQKSGYIPQKGLRINQPPLQGNYWPQTMIVGLWTDYAKREQFVRDITNSVPDFHAMRREIWSTFNLTYWEITADKTINIEAEKYNVLTSYWSEDQDSFELFTKTWLALAEQAGGEVLLELTQGTSPFGYNYDPDYLTISRWDSKEQFDAFYAKNIALDHKGVKHVNQFVIE